MKKSRNGGFPDGRSNSVGECEIGVTGTTGKYVKRAGLEVESKLSEPLRGDAQIGAMMVEKRVRAVIFSDTQWISPTNPIINAFTFV